MLLNEKDAQTKRCRVGLGRAASNAQEILCVSSDCMHWRWGETELMRETVTGQPKESGWIEMWNLDKTDRIWVRDVIRPNRRGYCGLAGTPMEAKA